MNMDWNELLKATGLGNEIRVTLINPLRKPHIEGGTEYLSGKLTGFKCGIMHVPAKVKKRDGDIMSYSSGESLKWKKKPKVHVTYDIFDWNGSSHSDWVDADNCTFKIM